MPRLTHIPYDVPMPSERVQRVIDGYLDEIEVAVKEERWNDVIHLSQTVLELDDTNEDAQTFANLAASRVSASTDHLDNEGSITADTSPPTEAQSDRPYEGFSDNALIQQFSRIIPSLERELDRFASVKGTSEDWDILRNTHAEIEFRDLSTWDSVPSLKVRYSDLMTRVAERNREAPEGGAGFGVSGKATTSPSQQEPESDYWRKRQGLAPLVVKQPSVVKQPGEPESDYWRKRQGLAPLRNQASGTSSSSDSPPQQEESGQSWMTYILYFVVAGVIGAIILALLGASLPEGGGGNAIMRFLIAPPIIWGLVWLVGKFKS